MRAVAAVVVALAVAPVVAACDAASPELGRDALLQIEGAQWAPGPAPDDDGGPAVAQVQLVRPLLLRDRDPQRVTGALAPGATAVWIGLDGDRGGWIVTAAPPSVETPTLPGFLAPMALAAAAPLGPATLRFVAVDEGERPGPATTETLLIEDAPPPAGTLVVALAWDGAADLDLHVLAPDGGEAWSGDPNTWEPPPPGTPIDPNAWRTGGLLDRDANAGCRRDARPREHVIWTMPPPAGRYLVRVDAHALCGDASAYFHVALYRDGALVASGEGLATPDDVLQPHGAGAGVTVLDLDLP